MPLESNREFESKKSTRLSPHEMNVLVEVQGEINADLVIQLPEFKPAPIMANYHDYSYYVFEKDLPETKKFKDTFLRSVRGIEDKKLIIEEAVRYILNEISWVGTEVTKNIGDIITSGRGSCTSKSLLMAYLLSEAGLRTYKVIGYAKNVSIEDCKALQSRNMAYKRSSHYQNNLFNLPLDPADKPIEEDVGHEWVAIELDGEVVYVDPTTGLLSVTAEESEIFRSAYKTSFPLGGIDNIEEKYAPYQDLDFKEPVFRMKVKVSGPVPENQHSLQSVSVEGPNGDLHDELIINGFENIRK